MRKIWLATLLLVLGVASAFGASKEEERLAQAAKAFDEIMSGKDNIPKDLLDKAECIVIIPGMKKGGFIVGGRYGKGMVSCRGTGQGGLGCASHAGDGWRQCRPSDWGFGRRCGDAGDES